jgi:hypothetical protein
MSLPKAVEVHGRVAMRVGAQALIGVQVYAWPRSVRSMILLSDGTQGAVRVLLDRTDASYPSGWFGAVSVCEDRLVLAWEDSNATQLRRIHGDGRVERIPAYDTLTWAKEISAFVESREGLVLSSAKAQSGHWHWIESGKTVRPWLKERTFAGDVYQIKELGGGREWGRNRWSGFVRDKATGAMRWLEPSLSISRAFLHAGLVTHIGYWRQGDPQFLLGNELYGVALQGGSHAIGGPCGARPLYLRSGRSRARDDRGDRSALRGAAEPGRALPRRSRPAAEHALRALRRGLRHLWLPPADRGVADRQSG